MMTRIAPLLLTSILFVLGSCMSIPSKVLTPKVELASLRVDDPSLTAATLVLGLRVDNPNSFGVDVDRMDYALQMNSREVGSGSTDKRIHIPGSDKTVVELPFRIPYATLFQSLQTLQHERKVDYVLTGKASIYGRTVPFQLKGQTDFPPK